MGRLLGAFAGTVAWAGWLAICPALGLPTLSGAAMLNRVLAPRDDPGALLGWALLLIGLASAALVYWLATDRSRWRASIASGLAYGLICWLVAGAVVMPLLGLLGPAAQSAPGAAPPPPDPMQGSFMMLHLGLAAPAAALVAWLLFGAVLGGSAGSRTDDAEWRRTLTIATGAALVVLAAVVVIANLRARPVVAPPTSPQTLATGPVEALPPGAVFVSVLELPQAPGATLGPHAHVAGFAYTLEGVATLQFGDSKSIRLDPGEGGFMGTQVAHAHGNAEGVVPAAVLALLIPAAAAAFCIAQGAPGRSARFAPALLAVLVAVAAVGAWNPWSNDWLFISVRPAAARGAGMPLPTASRVYESPDLAALPPGPYLETLEVITLGPGAAPFVVNSTGATVLLVLDGTVWRESADGSSRMELRGPMLAESGSSIRLISPGGGRAHVLAFSVSPASQR